MDTTPTLADSLTDALLMDGETHCFDKSTHCSRGVGMTQENSVNARCKNLRKHPCVCTNRRLIGAVYRHVDDDCRCPVAALRGTARRQPLHVFRETLDVVRSVFHVIADVVRPGLGVLLSLLETAGGSGMRSGV